MVRIRGDWARSALVATLIAAVAAVGATAGCSSGAASPSSQAQASGTPSLQTPGTPLPDAVTTTSPQVSTASSGADGTTGPRRDTAAGTPGAPAPAPDGACSIPTALRGQDVTVVSSRKVIALTFDAGANADGVDSILRTLAGTGTPATFFFTGRWAQSYPALARQVAATYPIGNHSMSHPEFPTLSDAQVRAQLDDARAAIVTASGQDPRPYFRFPSGAVDARTIRLVNDRCYVPFRWTTDTLGWQGTSGGRSAASVATRVLDQARPGGIVLMHVGSHPQDRSTLDAAALPQIIEGLRARGYGFVTLAELIPATP